MEILVVVVRVGEGEGGERGRGVGSGVREEGKFPITAGMTVGLREDSS